MTGQQRIFQKEASNIHQKQDRRHARLPLLAIDSLTILCSIDDITGYTKKNE